jgi:vacuolar-type H+-ATPase subunit H
MRGYHSDDVDQFLEQAALAMEVLQRRVVEAEERARRAESAVVALEKTGTTSDDTIKKTLVLAQRTADLVIAEAKEESTKLVGHATNQSQSIMAEAEWRARQLHEKTVATSRNELTRLERAKAEAEAQIVGMTSWIEEQRAHLVGALRGALSQVEGVGYVASPPIDVKPSAEAHLNRDNGLGGNGVVDTPATEQPMGEPATPAAGMGAVAADQPGEAAPASNGSQTPSETGSSQAQADPPPSPQSQPMAPSRSASAAVPTQAQPRLYDDDSSELINISEGAWPANSWPSSEDSDSADGGSEERVGAHYADPPVRDNPSFRGTDDETYFAELRRAVTGDNPLGPSDYQPLDRDAEEFYAQEFADTPRFGGRLRRRR